MATDEQGYCNECNREFLLSITKMLDGDGYECPLCYQRLKSINGKTLKQVKTN